MPQAAPEQPGFGTDLGDLPVGELSDLVAAHTLTVRRCEATVLDLACAWADRFPATRPNTRLSRRQPEAALDLADAFAPAAHEGDAAAAGLRSNDALVGTGGPGTPLVSVFAIAEFAVLRRLPISAGHRLIADALDLRHRLPQLNEHTRTGEIPLWLTRKAATRTRHLTADQAGTVDHWLAQVGPGLSAARFLTLLEAAILEADPAQAAARAEAAAHAQDVWTRPDDHGLATVFARIDAGDATLLLATLTRIADILRSQPGGDQLSAGRRRALALGLLARPLQALALLAGQHPDHQPDDTDEATLPAPTTGDGPTGPDPDSHRPHPSDRAEPFPWSGPVGQAEQVIDDPREPRPDRPLPSEPTEPDPPEHLDRVRPVPERPASTAAGGTSTATTGQVPGAPDPAVHPVGTPRADPAQKLLAPAKTTADHQAAPDHGADQPDPATTSGSGSRQDPSPLAETSADDRRPAPLGPGRSEPSPAACPPANSSQGESAPAHTTAGSRLPLALDGEPDELDPPEQVVHTPPGPRPPRWSGRYTPSPEDPGQPGGLERDLTALATGISAAGMDLARWIRRAWKVGAPKTTLVYHLADVSPDEPSTPDVTTDPPIPQPSTREIRIDTDATAEQEESESATDPRRPEWPGADRSRSTARLVRPEHRDAGPLTLDQLTEQLGATGARITVRPVVDPAQSAAVDSYQIPTRIRLAVRTRHPASVFPWSACTSPGMDLDHTDPYRPDTPPGTGQTAVDTLGPLARNEHNPKTHGGFAVRQPLPGLHLWRTPTGQHYLVTNTGTTALGRSPAAHRLWDAARPGASEGTGRPGSGVTPAR